jgi:hypothetical protein
MGGLGNQLFQIFTAISLSLKYKIPFKFIYSDVLTTGIHRPTYWNNFLSSLKIFTDPHLNTYNYIMFREPNFHFSSINLTSVINQIKTRGIMLHGYFQSYKYFQERFKDILKLIKFNDIQNNIKNKYSSYFGDNIVISLHFRLGDYKEKQEFHPIMNELYYVSSLNKIVNILNIDTERLKILYFCEKEDNDIVFKKIDKICNMCNVSKKNFVKIDDTVNDWEQMILMSCCNHNIIANSSFSWWGAYFNHNPDKIVCYPSIWFGDKIKNNTNDLFPSEWIKI